MTRAAVVRIRTTYARYTCDARHNFSLDRLVGRRRTGCRSGYYYSCACRYGIAREHAIDSRSTDARRTPARQTTRFLRETPNNCVVIERVPGLRVPVPGQGHFCFDLRIPFFSFFFSTPTAANGVEYGVRITVPGHLHKL